MKKLLVIAALFLLWAGLSANVYLPRYIARVWFDDSDACHVMFGREAWWGGFDVHDLSFTTSAGTFYLPDDYQLPDEEVFIINLNQEIPGFTIQRSEDFLTLALPNHEIWEGLRWGPPNDFDNDIRPLTPGQAAVHVAIPIPDYGYPYVTGAVYRWAKDNQLTRPVPYEYEAACNCTLSIHLEDSNGAPAWPIPVYSNNWQIAQTAVEDFSGSTDKSGNWFGTDYAIHKSVLVNDLQTGNTVIQEILYPEPGESIHLEGSLSGTYPLHTLPAGKLNLYPSLFGPSTERSLTLNYESVIPLSQVASLRLYDLRGRYISSKEMPIYGLTHWELPDLPSGIYFISITQNDRILARSRITIFK